MEWRDIAEPESPRAHMLEILEACLQREEAGIEALASICSGLEQDSRPGRALLWALRDLLGKSSLSRREAVALTQIVPDSALPDNFAALFRKALPSAALAPKPEPRS